jgi:hypothetical protein
MSMTRETWVAALAAVYEIEPRPTSFVEYYEDGLRLWYENEAAVWRAISQLELDWQIDRSRTGAGRCSILGPVLDEEPPAMPYFSYVNEVLEAVAAEYLKYPAWLGEGILRDPANQEPPISEPLYFLTHSQD